MPITFSVTCDSDAELARFLKSVHIDESLISAYRTEKKGEAAETNGKSAKSNRKKGLSGKPSAGSNRKTGQLTPIIESAIQEMVGRGKPFKSREVTALIMKLHPQLNENSVTTGVSKTLSQSNLKWEQIKDSVGRPYKLFKP